MCYRGLARNPSSVLVNYLSRLLSVQKISNYAGVTSIRPLTYIHRRLGDVVVSVLAAGAKGRGFEPGQGDGFLRAIKIRR
jgi:hypothetical protein